LFKKDIYSNNSLSKKICAKVISYLFDGSVLSLPIFLSIFFSSTESISIKLPSLLISIVFLVLIPYLLILVLYKRKKICDLHMSKKKERVLPLFFINLSMLAGFAILSFIQFDKLFYTIYLIYLIGLTVLSLITIFWKISFHTSYATIFFIIFITIYGKWAIFSVVLIPVMVWARVELKRHTIAQALSGVMITSLISLMVLYIGGLARNFYFLSIKIFKLFTTLITFLPLDMLSNRLNTIFAILSVIFIYYILNQKRRIHDI